MNSRVILAVEDEFLIREVLIEDLTDAGFEVLSASNADDALVLLEARKDIYLVMTDIDMPGSIDGLKLAALVSDRWPPVHIIITTGKHRPKWIPDRAQFVPKPYTADKVLEMVRAVC